MWVGTILYLTVCGDDADLPASYRRSTVFRTVRALSRDEMQRGYPSVHGQGALRHMRLQLPIRSEGFTLGRYPSKCQSVTLAGR